MTSVELRIRLAIIRTWTRLVRRFLTWVVMRSSESGRGYLEQAGINVGQILRGSEAQARGDGAVSQDRDHASRAAL